MARILVVDDEYAVRLPLRRAPESEGHEVSEAILWWSWLFRLSTSIRLCCRPVWLDSSHRVCSTSGYSVNAKQHDFLIGEPHGTVQRITAFRRPPVLPDE